MTPDELAAAAREMARAYAAMADSVLAFKEILARLGPQEEKE